MKLIFILLSLISLASLAGLPPTTSKVSGDSADFTTFKYRFPNFTGTRTGTTTQLDVNSIAGGGTGQTIKAAAFDALSPMTTGGDIIYGGVSGTGTRLANGTSGQFLKSNGTTSAPSWASASNTAAITSKTGSYTLTTSDQVVYWDTSGGAGTATLPTAVGNAGLTLTVAVQVAGNALTVNTTSSQTIAGIASGAITISRVGDRLVVVSNGTNWTILEITSGALIIPGLNSSIDILSVSYGTTNATTVCSGTPCFVDQIGTGVSSITRASAGTYTLNTVRTYAKLKCWLTPGSNSEQIVTYAASSINLQCSSCSSIAFTTSSRGTGAATDSVGNLMCHGSY